MLLDDIINETKPKKGVAKQKTVAIGNEDLEMLPMFIEMRSKSLAVGSPPAAILNEIQAIENRFEQSTLLKIAKPRVCHNERTLAHVYNIRP